MEEPLAKDQDKFVLRLPEGMRDRIAEAARANNRSMNAEVVAALLEKYPPGVDFDYDAFFGRWLEPLIEINQDAYDHRQRGRMLADADKAARDIHPNLGVWDRHVGNRLEVVFGVRDPSRVPPAVRTMLQGLNTRIPVRFT